MEMRRHASFWFQYASSHLFAREWCLCPPTNSRTDDGRVTQVCSENT